MVLRDIFEEHLKNVVNRASDLIFHLFDEKEDIAVWKFITEENYYFI